MCSSNSRISGELEEEEARLRAKQDLEEGSENMIGMELDDRGRAIKKESTKS